MKYLKFLLLIINLLFSEVQIQTNKDSFLVGEHIEVYFGNLESYGSDWIGIYQTNTLNEDYIYCEDYDWWIRILLAEIKINYLPISLVKYRVHNKNMTSNKEIQK